MHLHLKAVKSQCFSSCTAYFLLTPTPGSSELTVIFGKTGRKYGDGLGRISLPQAGTKFQNLALAKSFSLKCRPLYGEGSGMYH